MVIYILNKYILKRTVTINFEHFSLVNKEIKCSVVKRFNRTIKTRMYKYLPTKSMSQYIDVL